MHDLGVEAVGLEPGRPISGGRPAARARLAVAVRDRRRQRAARELTHMGKYHARIAARRHPRTPRRPARRPRRRAALAAPVVFTDPQVAAVGHTLESRARGGDGRARGGHRDLGRGGWFLLRPWRPGHVAARRRREPALVVGATFVGADVSEFVHAATIAVVGEVPLERLWHATPCSPRETRSGCACSRRTACDAANSARAGPP